jgi:hypothetical protein
MDHNAEAMRKALPSIVSNILQTPPSSSTDDNPMKHGNRPGKRPAARGTAFYARKRSNTACQPCRARKTKCDNNFPSCSSCTSVGATCIQSSVDLSSFDPASLRILGRLDELERTLNGIAAPLKAVIQATNDNTSNGNTNTTNGNNTTNNTNSNNTTNNNDNHNSIVIKHRANSVQELPTWANSDGSNTEPGSMNNALQVNLYPDPESLCKWSHLDQQDGFQIARQVTLDPAGKRTLTCLVLPQRIDHILTWTSFREESQILNDNRWTTFSYMSDFGCGSSTSTSLFDILESDAGRMHHLLDGFFIHIHGSNPILDETSARRMVKETVLKGIDWSPQSCLTLIICALGCLATPFGSNSDNRPGTPAYKDAQVLFEASQKRLGPLLMRSDLFAAQCLFLSGVYTMLLFQPVQAWRFFLQASAVCQTLPSINQARLLASTPASLPTSPAVSNAETQEQAVYWSAWKSERELRGDLSLPDFETYDTGSILYPPFFPTPPIPNENVLNQSQDEALRAREAWLYYLADISLRRLTSRVCNAMLLLHQKTCSNTEFLTALLDVISDNEAQVLQWRNGLPTELSLPSSGEDDTINRYFLRGKMINFYEIIYWPFAVGCISRLSEGLTMPPQFHEMASRGLDTLLTQIQINERGFELRHHGCFFMIRSCTRSALVLIAAAKAGAKMPLGWEANVLKVTKMHLYWENEDAEVASWRGLIERELAMIGGGHNITFDQS